MRGKIYSQRLGDISELGQPIYLTICDSERAVERVLAAWLLPQRENCHDKEVEHQDHSKNK